MKKLLLLLLAIITGINSSVAICTTKAPDTQNPLNNPLFIAAIQGNENQIRELVANDSTLKANTQNMATALSIAVACHNVGATRALLNLGADPNLGVDSPGMNNGSWAAIEAMACFLKAAVAFDTKESCIAIGQDANGDILTKDIPKTDEQRAQDLISAQKVFEIIVANPKSNLLKKNNAGLSAYVLVCIGQPAIKQLENCPKTIEAMTCIKQTLERELTKRGIKPETALKDAPQQVTRALKQLEEENKKNVNVTRK